MASADGVVDTIRVHYLKFEDDADKPSVSFHSHKDLHLKVAANVMSTVQGSSTTTVEEGNYVQQVGDTLKINAKTAVHFVCGQSRLSITSSDIIVEADDIAFDSMGAALAPLQSIAASAAADVTPTNHNQHFQFYNSQTKEPMSNITYQINTAKGPITGVSNDQGLTDLAHTDAEESVSIEIQKTHEDVLDAEGCAN